MPSSSEKRRTRVVQTESLVTEFHHRRRSSSVSPQEERECVPAVVPLPHHPFPFRAEMKSVPLIQMILMVLLMPAEYASGQSRGNPSFKVKKVSIQDQGTRLQCLSCSSDFSTVLLDTNDICYNPSGAPPQRVKKTLMTICPMDVAFCVVQINRIAGVFSGITRSCGSSSCVESCSQAGYGTERETCTFCCSGIPTNSTEEDGMSADKFNCP